MSKKDLDDDYYFITKCASDNTLPFLVPDENTEKTNFRFEPLPFGSPPLIFRNGRKAEFKERKINGSCPPILFSGTDLVVDSAIREKLLALDVPNLYPQHAIYIDDKDQWHENYWYLTFTERLDCWDRGDSEYEQDIAPVRLGGFELYQIYAYSLDENILGPIPLDQRLLFKLGGALSANVLCHKSLLPVFNGNGNSGADVTPVNDF